MANRSPEDRDALKGLIAEYFANQGDPAGGSVVETLASVGMGYLNQSLGNLPPISRSTERQQLAAFLGSTYLQGTRPSPMNNYLRQLQQVAEAYFDDLHVARPPAEVVTILATLAVGHTRETDPRPTRMVATTKFVDLYLGGS